MPIAAAVKKRLGITFEALKYPNYRLWFFGQLVSLFGTWMQSTAQGFLIYDLTKSPAYLGAVAFATGIPVWIFMLFAGVIADRMSKRTLILYAQMAMMVLAFILAFLTITGTVQPWHIIILAFLLGIANAFDAPTRQAFVIEMVGRDALPNAIALNSTMFNAAIAIGPAVGGLAYAKFGPAWCFILNGLTYTIVIGALVKMKIPQRPRPVKEHRVLQSLSDGMKYIGKNKDILSLSVLVSVIGIFGISFVTLLPAWSVKVLLGDARTNGFLMAARGAGAFFGALILASLGKITYMGRILTAGTFVFPAALLLFAFSRKVDSSIGILLIAGLAQISILNLTNMLIQGLTPDEYRGRVMSFYMFTFFGFMPIGSLFMGVIAERISLPFAVISGALTCLIMSFYIWIRKPHIRRL